MLNLRASAAHGGSGDDRTLPNLLRDERGFTLIELLIVMVLVVILTSLAVPGYLRFRDNAYQATAKSNVKGLVIASELYGTDNFAGSTRDPDAALSTSDSGYAGMTVARLKTSYDSNLAPGTYVNNSGTEAAGVTQRYTLDATHFCVYATSGRWFVYEKNPTGPLMATTVAAAVCS